MLIILLLAFMIVISIVGLYLFIQIIPDSIEVPRPTKQVRFSEFIKKIDASGIIMQEKFRPKIRE